VLPSEDITAFNPSTKLPAANAFEFFSVFHHSMDMDSAFETKSSAVIILD